MRFGIMGAARIAHKFVNAVNMVEGAVVAAVASKSEERAKTFAAAHGIESYYGSYEEMLRRDDIDIIYVATTINFHYENIMQCLKWNKHVMCEKCMVTTYDEADRIFAEAERKGLFVMECMWSRYLPKSRKVKQWIDDGRIGTVKLAQATLGWLVPYDPASRMFNTDLGGGAMFDLGVYPLELFSYYMDQEIKEVQPMVTVGSTGVDETVNLSIRYDGYYANIQCSMSTKLPEDAYIYGDNGYIYIKKLHMGNGAQLFDRDDNLVESFDFDEPNGFVYQIQDAIACVKGGKTESGVATHKMTLDCCRVFDRCLRNIPL